MPVEFEFGWPHDFGELQYGIFFTRDSGYRLERITARGAMIM